MQATPPVSFLRVDYALENGLDAVHHSLDGEGARGGRTVLCQCDPQLRSDGELVNCIREAAGIAWWEEQPGRMISDQVHVSSGPARHRGNPRLERLDQREREWL